MSHYKIRFLWISMVIFLLPMIINIVYAIFPVLYFMSAALWLHNYIACGFMFIFGIVHIVITVRELRGGEEAGERSNPKRMFWD